MEGGVGEPELGDGFSPALDGWVGGWAVGGAPALGDGLGNRHRCIEERGSRKSSRREKASAGILFPRRLLRRIRRPHETLVLCVCTVCVCVCSSVMCVCVHNVCVCVCIRVVCVSALVCTCNCVCVCVLSENTRGE